MGAWYALPCRSSHDSCSSIAQHGRIRLTPRRFTIYMVLDSQCRKYRLILGREEPSEMIVSRRVCEVGLQVQQVSSDNSATASCTANCCTGDG